MTQQEDKKKEIDIKPDEGCAVQNKRGQWVPAIEEPYPHSLTVQCRCGKYFWSRERYREHYAYKHILAL